jgi:hypothetical protein
MPASSAHPDRAFPGPGALGAVLGEMLAWGAIVVGVASGWEGLTHAGAVGILLFPLVGGLLGQRLLDASAPLVGLRVVGGFFLGVWATLACLAVLLVNASILVAVVVRDAYWGGWITGYFFARLFPIWLVVLLIGGALGARWVLRAGRSHPRRADEAAGPSLGRRVLLVGSSAARALSRPEPPSAEERVVTHCSATTTFLKEQARLGYSHCRLCGQPLEAHTHLGSSG